MQIVRPRPQTPQDTTRLLLLIVISLIYKYHTNEIHGNLSMVTAHFELESEPNQRSSQGNTSSTSQVSVYIP